MMIEAQARPDKDDAHQVSSRVSADDDSAELSETSVHRLLEPGETRQPLRSAIGIVNGVMASLLIWLAIGAIAIVATLLS